MNLAGWWPENQEAGFRIDAAELREPLIGETARGLDNERTAMVKRVPRCRGIVLRISARAMDQNDLGRRSQLIDYPPAETVRPCRSGIVIEKRCKPLPALGQADCSSFPRDLDYNKPAVTHSPQHWDPVVTANAVANCNRSV